MLGGPRKKLLGDKKKEKEAANDNKRVSDLETRIEQLQKTLKEKETIITDLKEKNSKQEKKIDDQTRARLVKEKDATILELKERIRKKDDQTRARLAHPDSPVAKSVLDATLQENRDLHLRIEAMLLQVHEEKRLSKEATLLADSYKRELGVAESKNVALERELQLAKADIAKLQLHLGLNDSAKPATSLSTSNSSASSASTTPTKTSLPSSPRDHTNSNSTTFTTPTKPASLPSSPRGDNQATSVPIQTTPNNTTTSTHSTPTSKISPSKDNHPTFGDSTLSSDSSISEGDTFESAITALSPSRDELAGLESSLESYDDLSKLAKELGTEGLDSGSSLNDLMISLDSVATPVQGLDFTSLSRTNSLEFSNALVSPTAHVERRPPFQTEESEYDKDFISMFSPSSSNNYNQLKVRVRHHSPALNNLFYSEDPSPSPPSFNLEGIDGDYLATNHDSLLSSPPHSPITLEASTSAVPWGRTIPSPVQSPTSQAPPPAFPLNRSRSTSPQQDVDAPTRGKGTHKSIFSVFGNSDETNGTNDAIQAPASLTSSVAHDELLLSFGSKVDTNKVGLRRAKKVNLAAFSSKGKAKVEPTMEDVHFCIYPYLKSKSKALFAVFDGHAGRAAADEASNLFPQVFASQLEACSQDVHQAFLKTYASVDNSMKEYEYMGTTATVVYLWQKAGHKFLQASNVGDSTAYLCRNGSSVRLTFDHKPSAQEEKERMRLSGIEVNDNQTRINGLAVSRSLGNHFVKEQNIGMIATPYVGECIEILPTDTYLIVASDGLWDVVSSQHAMDIIKGMEALQAAGVLLSSALASTKCNDNVSIIVVRLN